MNTFIKYHKKTIFYIATEMNESNQLKMAVKTLQNLADTIRTLLNKKQVLNILNNPPQKPMISSKKIQPNVPQKKKQNMTYYQFLAQSIKNLPIYYPESHNDPYTLQEDVTISVQLSAYQYVQEQTFVQLSKAKKLSRSLISIRERYISTLMKLNQAQVKKIVNWIEQYGIQGFLSIKGKDITIQLIQRKESKHIQRKDVSLQCKQLNDVLKIYSKMVAIPVKILLQLLDRLSGDMEALDDYIEKRDQRLLWTRDEDQCLSRGGIEVKLLRIWRGDLSVSLRYRYLGVEQPMQ